MFEPNAGATCTTLAESAAGGRRPAPGVDILLIERDADCADALDVLLSGLPEVHAVRSVASTHLALSELARRQIPQLILLDSHVRTRTLQAEIRALRVAAPDAAIVLLCLYPEALSADIAALVNDAISKDTRRSELIDLLARLADGKG